ncbi:MAG: flagellar protein FliS, partial [Desulfovibrionaceae bacterium]|nr:flagellar protein FliS [Desulfovibrionaceae bacterium]
KVSDDKENIDSLPKQVQAVLALYDKLLQSINRLSACVMDKRMHEAETIRLQCLSILKTLDIGLELEGELAENLHTLYGHCLRRLVLHEGYTELEAIDSVRLVITRIRDVYLKVARQNMPPRSPFKPKIISNKNNPASD